MQRQLPLPELVISFKGLTHPLCSWRSASSGSTRPPKSKMPRETMQRSLVRPDATLGNFLCRPHGRCVLLSERKTMLLRSGRAKRRKQSNSRDPSRGMLRAVEANPFCLMASGYYTTKHKLVNIYIIIYTLTYIYIIIIIIHFYHHYYISLLSLLYVCNVCIDGDWHHPFPYVRTC